MNYTLHIFVKIPYLYNSYYDTYDFYKLIPEGRKSLKSLIMYNASLKSVIKKLRMVKNEKLISRRF